MSGRAAAKDRQQAADIATERDKTRSEQERLRKTLFETEHGQLPALTFSRTQDGADDQINDADLVARIIAAYQRSLATMDAPSDSAWETAFFDRKLDVHKALVGGDWLEVQRMLRRPKSHDLFYGFDNLCRSVDIPEPSVAALGHEVYRDLLLLLEALGGRRLRGGPASGGIVQLPPIENLLPILDSTFGFEVTFPNPFAGEVGLATGRGTASYRAVQALYQSQRIQHFGATNVVEIGGGLARTALYAWQSGVHDYTLVDLPLTGVAQAYFLGRTLGPKNVCLFGEEHPGIRVLPPGGFLQQSSCPDLVLNVESLPEISRETAVAYVTEIRHRASRFLSINHEIEAFTVAELCAEAGMPAVSRSPYWLRRGYVEELFTPDRRR